MIIINLSRILYKNDISQRELSKATGIRSATIGAYYHGTIKRINVEDLDKICDALDIEVGELITRKKTGRKSRP